MTSQVDGSFRNVAISFFTVTLPAPLRRLLNLSYVGRRDHRALIPFVFDHGERALVGEPFRIASARTTLVRKVPNSSVFPQRRPQRTIEKRTEPSPYQCIASKARSWSMCGTGRVRTRSSFVYATLGRINLCSQTPAGSRQQPGQRFRYCFAAPDRYEYRSATPRDTRSSAQRWTM